MDEATREALDLSHGFINMLSAAYQGAYVYERALEQLGDQEAEERAAHMGACIAEINGWWSAFKRHEPLLAKGEPLTDSGSRAWQLSCAAGERLRLLVERLMARADVEVLLFDRASQRTRVAALCETAYVREHFIQGLICYGDVMDRPEIADRYRQHLLSCQAGVREAHGLLQQCGRADVSQPKAEVTELLDATLMVPAVMMHRILDINQILGGYTGSFEFVDVGIEPSQEQPWRRMEMEAYEAGRWHAVGFTAEETARWIRGGVPEALGAANFRWRGMRVQEAGPWYARGFGGREAAAWSGAGVGVEEAASWRSRGVRRPRDRNRTA